MTKLGVIAATAVVLLAGNVSAQPLGPQGPEIAVNAYTTNVQEQPEVACTGDASCVVVWTSTNQDGDGAGVVARRFDASGAALGGEQLVNSTTAGEQAAPDVCTDAAGAFVVTWSGAGGGDASGVFARRYDALGGALGAEFLVNTYTTGAQSRQRVACAADGSFVIAWSGYGTDTDANGGVYAQRFDSAGAPAGTEFRVNTATALNESLGGLSSEPGGEFVVAWQAGGAVIQARRYDSLGAPLDAEFTVAQAPGYPYISASVFEPDVAHDPTGGFVVGWSATFYGCHGSCGGDWLAAVARYEADGTLAGTSQTHDNTLMFEGRFGPSVAAGTQSFVAVWDLFENYDTPTQDVYAGAFDFDADELGPKFAMNANMTGTRRTPAIAYAGDDRYLAAWAADAQDGDSLGIIARFLCDNADGDTLCDADDPCPLDPDDDLDGDGLCADADNCPGIANPGQQDSDGDLVGDPCDACPGFDDAMNADGDALPDACDACPADPDNDVDGDGLCGNADNCPAVANSGQENGDGDASGDACDLCLAGDDAVDVDVDGTPDACDACVNPFQQNFLHGKPRLGLRFINNGVAGDDRLLLKGTFEDEIVGIRPDLYGARVALADNAGAVLMDATLPPGIYAGSGTAGWTEKDGNWQFRDKTGAPVAGIDKLRVKRKPTATALFVGGRRGTYPVVPGDEPLRIIVELGDSSAGFGVCTEKYFNPADCEFKDTTTLTCRQ